MDYCFQVGEEVIYFGLQEITLIVEHVNETTGGVRCKYYDDALGRFIKLTLPGDSLAPKKTPKSHK